MPTRSSRPSRNIREQALPLLFVTVDIDDSSMKTSRNSSKITLVALLQPFSHKHRYIGWLIRAWRRLDRRLLFDHRQRIRMRRSKSCRWWGRIRKVFLAPTRSLSSSLLIFWSMKTFQLVPYLYRQMESCLSSSTSTYQPPFELLRIIRFFFCLQC